MTETTVRTHSVKRSEMWQEMLDCPEVRGAFHLANDAHMTQEEGMEMALLALFSQNQRLREGLVTIAREINTLNSLRRGFDEDYQPIHGDTRGD